MKEFRLLYLIGDIQDKFILEAAQEQQDTRRGGFSKKIRYCALGLCAAMALCAGLVVYAAVPAHFGQFGRPSKGDYRSDR